ncbi:WD repeat-containing protein 64 [Holothuria leucospilota]|uniref:WD repeat-containing protein 64 n=1 Tax=Holothuria leucospilota TaxID=206669 RepID=A0A9Q1CI56_HOLLE|nr:WD repeat-containing protein 64 [Holothuria leucospilota]
MLMMDNNLDNSLSRPYTSNTFGAKLRQFETLIAELTQQDSEASAEQRRQAINENLRFDTFCEAIRALFGPDIRSTDLKAIFRKISTNPDAEVDWSEIFGYFQTEDEDPELVANEDISVFTVAKKQRIGEAAGDKKRRDVIYALMSSPQVDMYVSASQKGAISVWNSKTLKLVSCCELNETTWTTGVDYLPRLRRLAITSERSLCIWDHRAKGKNQSLFCIKPLENSIHCMTQVPYSKSLHEDCILYGDDQGYVNLVIIAAKDLNTKHALVEKKSGNLILEPNTLTHEIYRRKIHDDWVLKVKYLPDLDCFASCSASSTTSFVVEPVERLRDNQTIRPVAVPKGVNAFAMCSRANIIATGGNDKVVRIWHPHIFTRPTGKLIGHLFTIIDVAVNEKDQHVISLSTARVFRVWDIHTLTSLQVFADNEERPGEKRIHHIVFDEKHERLITASSVLDAWPLTRTIQDNMQVPHTHDRPVCQVLYNAELNQIVTVCTESVIKVWEMETGKLVYLIKDSHGHNVEVTAISVDETGYRLVSGAVDGSVKVWDFGSGQEIRSWSESYSARDDELSINSVAYCSVDDRRCVAVIGWNNKIRLMEDSLDHGELTLYAEFTDAVTPSPSAVPSSRSSSHSRNVFNNTPPLPDIVKGGAQITSFMKKDHLLEVQDLSCMAYLPPNTIATGCKSGDLILWDTYSAVVKDVFHIAKSSEGNDKKPSKVPYPKKVHAAMFLIHRTRKTDPAYIKKLTEEGHIPVSQLSSEEKDDTSDKELESKNNSVNEKENEEDTTEKLEAEEDEDCVENGGSSLEDGSDLKNETGPKDDKSDLNQNGSGHEDDESGSKEDVTEGEDEGIEEETDKKEEDLERGSSGRTSAEVKEGRLKKESADPNAKMLVTTYQPILLSCHEDSLIRFWNLKGDLLQEVSAMTRRQGSPVTAVCADEDCNTIITGDFKGHITIWGVSDFLQKIEEKDEGVIEQLISWRAHLSKIVSLVYINHMTVIVSGSVDGSVRVWYAGEFQCGHFMGFFNQHRPWNFPSVERSSTPVLPYDITERPLRQAKHVNEKKIKQRSYDYPLVFADSKWKPLRRSAYFDRPLKKNDLSDVKFFDALEKPHFYNDHLQSFKTGDMQLGAVFRALPVYRIGTPERIKTPAMNTTLPSNSYLFAPPPRTARSMSPIREPGKVSSTNQQGQLRRRGTKGPSQLNASLPQTGQSLPSSRRGNPTTHGSI